MSKVININATDKHYKKIILDHVNIILKLEHQIEYLKTLLTVKQLKQLATDNRWKSLNPTQIYLPTKEFLTERLKEHVTE